MATAHRTVPSAALVAMLLACDAHPSAGAEATNGAKATQQPAIDTHQLKACCKHLAGLGMASGPDGNALVDLGGACDEMVIALEQHETPPELEYTARKDYLEWLGDKRISEACRTLLRNLIRPL